MKPGKIIKLDKAFKGVLRSYEVSIVNDRLIVTAQWL